MSQEPGQRALQTRSGKNTRQISYVEPFQSKRFKPSLTKRLRDFGVSSEISEDARCKRSRSLARPDILCCWFGGHSRTEAGRITCWRVSCDDGCVTLASSSAYATERNQ